MVHYMLSCSVASPQCRSRLVLGEIEITSVVDGALRSSYAGCVLILVEGAAVARYERRLMQDLKEDAGTVAFASLRAGGARDLSDVRRFGSDLKWKDLVTDYLGSLINVNGLVRSIRKQKSIAFAAIGDGSTLAPLQVVLKPEQAEGLSTGIGVSIHGQWRASPSGTRQSHELHAESVRICGEHNPETYPLQKKYHTPEFLRTIPHLRARLPVIALLLRLRSHCISSLTHFFEDRNFVQTHPPVITSSDCEGAGEVFNVSSKGPPAHSQSDSDAAPAQRIPFFRTQKYLTVSYQLHLEALAQSVGKVWTLSPTFRAEKSDTPRHLSEFYMLEAEMAFTEELSQVMDLVEDMLRHVTITLRGSQLSQELLAVCVSSSEQKSQLTASTAEQLSRRWDGMMKANWPRITYAEANDQLVRAVAERKVTFEFTPSFDEGFKAEHERFLANEVGKGSPVFITHYPRASKPFYMGSSEPGATPDSESTVACFDLLVPELCEIVGGSIREHRFDALEQAMVRHGLIKGTNRQDEVSPSPDINTKPDSEHERITDLQWYLDLRRYGSVPHGGFGLGFDRLLGYLAGVPNIRDVVSFPRWYGRCDC